MTTPIERLYDEDYYLWTRRQAAALRQLAAERWNGPLDLIRLAEEVDDLGKGQRNALRSLVRHLIVHLLLLEHSAAAGPRAGWRAEILAARGDIDDRLSRTLRRDLAARLPRLYANARARATAKLEEHGEAHAASTLPERCPYTLARILDQDWFPAP